MFNILLIGFLGGWSRKMRQVRFPPFGFGFSEFGFREPFKTPFWAFFDCRNKSVFEIRVQKDAPGPISPLRVRIFGVWAPGACSGPVLCVFRFSDVVMYFLSFLISVIISLLFEITSRRFRPTGSAESRNKKNTQKLPRTT